MADEPKEKKKCNTCNEAYPDGGFHRGADVTQEDGYAARQDGLARAKYVGDGGASVTARDGGFHFGGSSAGQDMMMSGGHAGFYDGYNGVLEQGATGDCANVATVNRLAETNDLSGADAQRLVMNMDQANGPVNQLDDAARQVGYTNVSIDSNLASNGDLSQRLATDGARAQTLAISSPDAFRAYATDDLADAQKALDAGDPGKAGKALAQYDVDAARATSIKAGQAGYGIDLTGDTTGHAMTIDRVTTLPDGTQTLTVSNPWGIKYQVPAGDLGKLGVTQILYADPPAKP